MSMRNLEFEVLISRPADVIFGEFSDEDIDTMFEYFLQNAPERKREYFEQKCREFVENEEFMEDDKTYY